MQVSKLYIDALENSPINLIHSRWHI